MAVNLEQYQERAAKRGGQKISREEARPVGEGNYAISTIASIPSSAGRFAKDIVQPIVDPVGTFKSVTALGRSVLGLIPGIDVDDTLAKEVGKYYADRYKPSELAKTLRDDPVGFAGDLSLLLTGGAGAVRAAGKAGAATEKVASLGRAIDPVQVAGKGADIAGRFADAASANVLRSIQSAGSGVKPQVFEIAFKDTYEAPNLNFREGFKGDRIKDADIVAEAENIWKTLDESNTKKFDAAAKAAKLNTMKLDDKTLTKIRKVLDNLKKNNKDKLIKTELDFLKDIESQFNQLYKKPTADSLRNTIIRINKMRPSSFIEGGKVNQALIDNVLGKETGLRGIFDKLEGLPEEFLKVKEDYSKVLADLEMASQDLGLGKNVKRDTVLNNLKKTLSRVDNIPEESLLKLPGGQAIRDKIAGTLARDIVPEQYLRTAGAAGTIGVAGAGTGILAGLPGILGAGAIFSPRVGTELNRLAGRLRRGVPRIREGLLEPIREPLTYARPLGTTQEEVYEPLQRRGLL